MRKSAIRAFLVFGVILFFIGLLMLVGEAGVIGFFSLLFPSDSIEVVAVIFQGIGGLLIVYASVKSLTAEFIEKSGKENQAILSSMMQSIDRVDKRTADVAERVSSMEKAYSTVQFTAPNFGTCRFCGASVQKGSVFCPNCGKAQA